MTATTSPARSGAPAGAGSAALSRPSLGRLIAVELRKTYDTRAGFWLLLVIALGVVAVAAIQLFAADDEFRTFQYFIANTQLPVGVLLPVLGVLSVTSEWSQRTALTTFTLVPQRSRILVAKIVATSLLALLAVAASLVVSALANALTPVLTDAEGSWSIPAEQVLQVVVVQVIFVLVGVAFGMLLLSSPLAIVLYFVLPVVFTIVVNLVGALDWVQDWLDLSTTTVPMYEGELQGEGWAQVGASTALWGVLPMVLGWLRISRTEIS